MRLKVLVLQTLYNLSDNQSEFISQDRLSFKRLLGLGLSDKVPDAKTICSVWRLQLLNAITEKLKRQSRDDFHGRHFEAWLIVQAVTWYLRYPLSYRDLEEMFRERGRSGPQHDEPLGPCLCAGH